MSNQNKSQNASVIKTYAKKGIKKNLTFEALMITIKKELSLCYDMLEDLVIEVLLQSQKLQNFYL